MMGMRTSKQQQQQQEQERLWVHEIYSEEPFDQCKLQIINMPDGLERDIPSVRNIGLLDTFLLVVKMIFFFLPGIALIHLASMGLALMFLLGEFEISGYLGFSLIGMALTMFGLGKISDLRYLKTVLTIIGFSLIFAFFYDFLAILLKVDFFALFSKITYVVLVIVGYLSKKEVENASQKKIAPKS